MYLLESENFKKGTPRIRSDGEFLRTKSTSQAFLRAEFLSNILSRQSFQNSDTLLAITIKGDITDGTVGTSINEEKVCEEMTP